MKEVRITEVGGIFLAKSLIITEKPSVAQEFARILGVSGRNDGYIEIVITSLPGVSVILSRWSTRRYMMRSIKNGS